MSIPGNANSLLLTTTAETGYQVSRSLRFNSSDSAYLSRTNGNTASTYTLSLWVKRSSLNISGGNPQYLFSSGNAGLAFSDTNAIYIWDGASAITSPGVYRDVSAWYHVVLSVSSGTGTIYVNNQSVASGSAASLSASSNATNIGRYWNSGTGLYYFNGYLADVHFIDGQALDPTSFTEVSATTGQLIPKAYTGTFGTNGFWLKFSDNSNNTAATLGKDYSPNGNNWTPNNLSVTAGAGNDSLVDTPTSYGTDTGAGGEVRGNYCTWNPLNNPSGSTLTNGNLDYTSFTTTYGTVGGTIAVSSGKWYWEIVKTGGAASPLIGFTPASRYSGATYPQYAYYSDGSTALKSSDSFATSTAYGATYTTNDVIGVALDLDAGTCTFYKNGVSQGQAFTGISGTFVPAVSDDTTGPSNTVNVTANFGQRPFAYTAPSGFKALCDTNLPAPVVAKPNTVMDVKLYTGNSSTQTISGLGFSPDLVWVKARVGVRNHVLSDTIRGTNNVLSSNTTGGEVTPAINGQISAFNTDGFAVAAGSSTALETNNLNDTYVAWCWDAGSSTVTNTQGSITGGSQVRANASAGFSVVTYSQGASNSTVGHGLGVAPHMIIAKSRTVAGARWDVYHRSLGKDKYLYLDGTDATGTASNYWGSVEPTSTTFGVSLATYFNNTGNMVAYCFAPVAGYSAMGSYEGTSGTGAFVWTGMRPRWLLVKKSSSTSAWYVFDSARDSYNVVTKSLYPNLANAEDTSGTPRVDFLSNGFKIVSGANDPNDTGTWIYYAVAENPFQYARAR